MFRQLTISAGIVLMLFAVAAIISFFIAGFFPRGLSFDNQFMRVTETITNLGIYIALPTLVILSIVIQFLSMVVRKRHRNQEQNPLVKQKIPSELTTQYTNKQQNKRSIQPQYNNPINIGENPAIHTYAALPEKQPKITINLRHIEGGRARCKEGNLELVKAKHYSQNPPVMYEP
jgi:hypothetical protein